METNLVSHLDTQTATLPVAGQSNRLGAAGDADLQAFVHTLHEYLRQSIASADTKAAFIFAAASSIMAYLNSQGVPRGLLSVAAVSPLTASIGISSQILLLLAIVFSIGTVWPRTRGKSTGIFFWLAIASRENSRAYADEIQMLTSRELADGKLEHCWELARVCERKYGLIKLSTYAGAAGFAAAVAYFALGL